jgi:hypothetical protein
MTTDTGRSGADAPSGYSAEPEPCSTVSAVSAVPVSIPNASPLTRRLELALKRLTRRTRLDRENDRIEGDVGL